jgi:hypothetical protein
MLGFRDTLTLAMTKLRVRRIRLVVTLVVSGLLFTTLIAGSLIMRGTLHSIDSFNQDRFGKRFFVQIEAPYHHNYYSNPAYIARALQLVKEREPRQVAEAKRLGVPFDPKTAKVVTELPYGDNKQQLNMEDPLVHQVLLELAPRNPARQDITRILQANGITTTYDSRFLGQGSISGGASIQLRPIIGGREAKVEENPYNNSSKDGSLSTFGTLLQAYDSEMLRPFLLPDADARTMPGAPVPVVAPVDAAEQLLGLKPLPDKTPASEKLARLEEVRTKIRDYKMAVCYRNKAEVERQRQAAQVAQEILVHRGDKDWTPPELILAEASTPCQPVAVKTDKRSAETKQVAAAQAKFDEIFNPTEPPVVTTITFRIVGLTPKPAMSVDQSPSLGNIMRSFLTSSLGEGWFIPLEAAQQQPLLAKIINDPLATVLEGSRIYAEFPDRASQKAFLDRYNCTDLSGPESFDTCAKEHRYAMTQYGNPLATLYDAQPLANKWFQIFVLIVAGLSAIVMMGTIGKIIADGRRETSVFRALGAKRLDIGQIYLLYTIILASLAFLLAFVIGISAALYLETQYSDAMSAQAVLAYNSADLHKRFHLIGLHLADLAAIYGFVIAAGLVAATLPLLANLRRNPIKDMREE